MKFMNKLANKIKFLAITNPIINPNEGDVSKINTNGGPLASLIARLWQTMIIVGSLLVILYFVWGAIDWLVGGGDENKLKKARGRMIDAFIGLALLVASFAIMKFMQVVFGFDLTKPVWPTP